MEITSIGLCIENLFHLNNENTEILFKKKKVKKKTVSKRNENEMKNCLSWSQPLAN